MRHHLALLAKLDLCGWREAAIFVVKHRHLQAICTAGDLGMSGLITTSGRAKNDYARQQQ